MSPQYAPRIPPSAHVFSSMPSQGDSLMPPPGYGNGHQYRPPPGLHPSLSPGYHIRRSCRPMSTMASPSLSSSRQSPSATPSPHLSPNISRLHLRDSSSSEPEPSSSATPVEGGILPSWFLAQIESSVIGLLSNLQEMGLIQRLLQQLQKQFRTFITYPIPHGVIFHMTLDIPCSISTRKNMFGCPSMINKLQKF